MPPPPTPKMPPPNKEGMDKQPRETTLSGETGHGETGPRFMASRGGLSPGTWRCDPPPGEHRAMGWGGGSGALQRLVGAVLRLDELDDEEDDGLDAEHQHDAADEAGGVKSGGVKFGAAGQRGAGGAGPWGQGEQGGGGVWVPLRPPEPSPTRIEGGFWGSEGGKAGMCPPLSPLPCRSSPLASIIQRAAAPVTAAASPVPSRSRFLEEAPPLPAPSPAAVLPVPPPGKEKRGKKRGDGDRAVTMGTGLAPRGHSHGVTSISATPKGGQRSSLPRGHRGKRPVPSHNCPPPRPPNPTHVANASPAPC